MSALFIFLGLLAVLIPVILLTDNSKARMRKRIARLKTRKIAAPKTAEATPTLRKQTEKGPGGFVGMLLKFLPDFERLNNRLERAGSRLSARQFTLRCLLMVLIFTFLAHELGKPPLLGFFLGIILAAWLPLKFLSFRIARKQKVFLQIFPDAIDLIVRGLRSGLPVAESVNLVSHEVSEPVAGTFTHVAQTLKLGVPLEKALQDAAKKLEYTEFNFFVTSIILQRETGGNLSEILNNLSEVLRKRYMMRMKIRAMTSEARASSIILGALPFLMAGIVSVISPHYITVLITDHRGHTAVAAAAGLLFSGVWVMNRMAKFEI